MIKTFRFALLACGLVGGALTATAAPAVTILNVDPGGNSPVVAGRPSASAPGSN
ncbi:MAG: hypothetical protein E7L38_09235 [Klebsiella pneumoniae]|nr:hypothetical protein [Klebsiella pneumoniae]